VDTYGVYEGDLESTAMKAALERSPKVYGGLRPEEAGLAAEFVERGGWLVAEFNAFASPTPREARRTMETTLGVRWTRWVGRYFPKLDSAGEVPQWMRDNYREIHRSEWDFSGAGWVLLKDDDAIEVLRVGEETARRGLTIERRADDHPWLEGVSGGVAYPYWFDIVEADEGTDTLLSYRWNVTARGKATLVRHGLPLEFPAVTHRGRLEESPYGPPGGARGEALYFAGDFADNPLPAMRVPFAGYATFRRGGEGYKWAPSDTAFFWRVYAPMMQNLLRDAAG